MKTIHDIGDCTGKVILLRLDLNVPVDEHGNVTDTTRIDRAKDTINILTLAGAKLVIMAHFGRPKGQVAPQYSLDILAPVLHTQWGRAVSFVRDCVGVDVANAVNDMNAGDILLLENLRFYEGEEKNDTEFARVLAAPADLYVNDAFSVSHRAHASTCGVTQYLPSYAGVQLAREVAALESALLHPTPPLCAVVGGAKISTKLQLLNHLIHQVDHLILGGGMANTFLAAQGADMKSSLVEADMIDEARSIAAMANQASCTIHLPVDAVCAASLTQNPETVTCDIAAIPDGMMMLDAGPQSIENLQKVVESAKTLIWNGPLGAFEFTPFDAGTNALACIVAKQTESGALTSIAGGGDTVSALNHAGVAGQLSYLSTAGGAFLEWMQGDELPGIQALDS